MEIDFNEDNSLRANNRSAVSLNKAYQKTIFQMRRVEKFLGDFSFLSWGRNIILCGTYVFSLQTILQSSELTIGNVISCCEHGCLADANTLLRKYRDDVFFYLYISVYDVYDKLKETEQASKMRVNIERWLDDTLCNLNISEVMRAIGESPQCEDAVKENHLKQIFESISDRLNNFVHSNGIDFYNKGVFSYKEDEMDKHLKILLEDIKIITVSFLFLLSICEPFSISSTDYIDCMECGLTPIEGSQYWVAPFIEEFLKENIGLIGENCLNYLRENISMKL